jgi:uncharacterized membrane protein
MSEHFKEEQHNAITDSGIARVIPCKKLEMGDPLKWLSLGLRDLLKAPVLTVFFGVFFAATPWVITLLVRMTGWHLVILPAMVCFMLIGPFLAAALYDISWEFEKGHKPSIWHAVKAIKRNAVNNWGFGIMLMVLMIFWLRVASMIHALYPPYMGENFEELLPFLVLGTIVGAIFTAIVFLLSAFTQPILMERRVDLATAVLTSVNAVWLNKAPMFVWAMIIFSTVVLGFLTGFIGFILLMPLIGYATWHAYIDTIEIKVERKYK